MAIAVDLHEKHAGQAAEPSRLNRAAHQRASILDNHLQGILPRIIRFAHRRPSILQQEPTGSENVDAADGEQWNAEPRDVKHGQR